jgi:hypothetical protein
MSASGNTASISPAATAVSGAQWPFSNIPVLAQALEMLREAAPGNSRFPARNFRLEQDIQDSRIKSYSSRIGNFVGTVQPLEALERFNLYHNQYLDRCVNSGARMDRFDTTAGDCPETFQLGLRLNEFGYSEDNLLLIRLEATSFIARIAGVSTLDLHRLATEVAEDVRNGVGNLGTEEELGDILFRWQEYLDNRPTFAAFWDDAQSVLADPQPGWAEEVRDRLGLSHLDPISRKAGAEIDVIVFRYPVRLIPRDARAGARLLLRPTVLDGGLSEAFCTAPAGSGVGCTVDLAGRNDRAWQEIIHPSIEMRPEHVWAAGTIKASAPEDLGGPRALHLIKLCERTGLDFQNLCELTDSDLM